MVLYLIDSKENCFDRARQPKLAAMCVKQCIQKKIDSTSFQLTEKITTTIDETNSCSCDRRALWLVLMHAYFFKYIYVVAYTFYIIFLMNFEDIKCQLASRQSTSNSF